MKKLIVAAMVAAFGSAVVLPAITNFDSAYAATKKSDKKKTRQEAEEDEEGGRHHHVRGL